MDLYNEKGVFPTSSDMKTNPVRCHYRPRSFMPLVIYLIWAYLTLPLLFSTILSAFGTGVMSFLGGTAVIVLSMLFKCSIPL